MHVCDHSSDLELQCSCPPQIECPEAQSNVQVEGDGNDEEKHQGKDSVEDGHGVVHGRKNCAYSE